MTLPALPSAGGALDTHFVYVPLVDGGTIALDRETGGEGWKTPVSSSWPLLLSGGSLILVGTDNVTAIDCVTGSAAWRTALRSNPIAPAIVAGDLVIVVLENEDVVALRAANGSVAWSVKIMGVAPPLALAADGTAVYLNVGKTTIAALALATGTEQWRQTLEGTLSAPVAAKGRVFVGSDANVFYALNPASRKKDKREWTWGAQFIGGDVVGAAVDGNQVFFVSLDNLVRAVDLGTGNQQWQKSIPTRPVAPPIAFGGAVFITGVSPAIAAFDAKSGAALGTYVAPTSTGVASAPILQGPPLIDPVLRPFRVAAAVITADGRAIGLRPTAMMFREPPVIPLAGLPGRPLTREVSPAALPRPAASRLP